MRPRIEAERALALISQLKAGTGKLKETDHRRYIAALERQAEGVARRPERVGLAVIAGLGIKVNDGAQGR